MNWKFWDFNETEVRRRVEGIEERIDRKYANLWNYRVVSEDSGRALDKAYIEMLEKEKSDLLHKLASYEILFKDKLLKQPRELKEQDLNIKKVKKPK